MDPAQQPKYGEVYNFGSKIICPIDKELPGHPTDPQLSLTGFCMNFEDSSLQMIWYHSTPEFISINWLTTHRAMIPNGANDDVCFMMSPGCGVALEYMTDEQLAAIPACITLVQTVNIVDSNWVPQTFDLETLRRLRKAGISLRRARFLLTLREVCAALDWQEMPPDMLREITLAAYPRLHWRQ